MKLSRFTEEQVILALCQAEFRVPVGDVCRHMGVVEATFYASGVLRREGWLVNRKRVRRW